MLIYDRRRRAGTYKLTRKERERMPLQERRASSSSGVEVNATEKLDYRLVRWVKIH